LEMLFLVKGSQHNDFKMSDLRQYGFESAPEDGGQMRQKWVLQFSVVLCQHIGDEPKKDKASVQEMR